MTIQAAKTVNVPRTGSGSHHGTIVDATYTNLGVVAIHKRFVGHQGFPYVVTIDGKVSSLPGTGQGSWFKTLAEAAQWAGI